MVARLQAAVMCACATCDRESTTHGTGTCGQHGWRRTGIRAVADAAADSGV